MREMGGERNSYCVYFHLPPKYGELVIETHAELLNSVRV